MLEFVGTGLLGSIFGGLFRLAPELLKFFDRKNEREHEFKMFEVQTDLEKVRGEFKVEEKYVDHSIAQLEAIQEAFKEQTASTRNTYRWVSAVSALVRPSVTYILFFMYVIYKFTLVGIAFSTGVDWTTIANTTWSIEDFGLLNMILTFWFVGRSIEKYEKTT